MALIEIQNFNFSVKVHLGSEKKIKYLIFFSINYPAYKTTKLDFLNFYFKIFNYKNLKVEFFG